MFLLIGKFVLIYNAAHSVISAKDMTCKNVNDRQ